MDGPTNMLSQFTRAFVAGIDSFSTNATESVANIRPASPLSNLEETQLNGEMLAWFEKALTSLGIALVAASCSKPGGGPIRFHMVRSRTGRAAVLQMSERFFLDDSRADSLTALGSALRIKVEEVHIFSPVPKLPQSFEEVINFWEDTKTFKKSRFYDLEWIQKLREQDLDGRAEKLKNWLDLETPSLDDGQRVIGGTVLEISDLEKNCLIRILSENAAGAPGLTPQLFFKALVDGAPLPPVWKNEVAGVWTGNANVDAQRFLLWAITKGDHPTDPRLTALGALLERLLPTLGHPDLGLIVGLIYKYQLLRRSVLERMTMAYQVPERAGEGGESKIEFGPEFLWEGPETELEFQAFFTRPPDYLDVGFLSRAVKSAQSVCRIEVQANGLTGTGFVVAHGFVLTNRHVLAGEGDLKDIANTCLLRFGKFELGNGKESEGQTVRLDANQPVVKSSSVDRLDYALLRMEESSSANAQIVPAQCSLDPIRTKSPLHILQHPLGKPMKLAQSDNGVFRVLPSGHVQYATPASDGSSGSPCFNDDWRVVALHHAQRARSWGSVRQGIIFRYIYDDLPPDVKELVMGVE